MKPYDRLPRLVEYQGKTYPLNLGYAAFFAAADALSDERLLPSVKLDTALDILVEGDHPTDAGLLSAIYELIRDDKPKLTGQKHMDIEQDWEYVCAAFQQAYGIDLYAEKDIHILRFRALLQGLPSGTRLSDIINIRAAEIPAPTKYNQKQIAELSRLKAQYALKSNEQAFQSGLAHLFDMLQERAKNG